MAIKISSILNVWKGSSSKKSSSSSSNKSSKSSSSTKSSDVKATSTKPVSKVSSSAKSTSVKSTSKSNTSTASKTNRSTASTKTTSSTTYLKDASKLYNSSGVAYSYGRPAESYVMENKLKAKTTSNKSTVAKKKEVKPQATQVPVAKKNTTAKKVYEPVDSRSAKGKYGNKNKAAEEGVSLAMSCVPIVGDGKDILEAVKGRDLITNKKLSGTERVITVAAAALPIIPTAPARKAVRKVATEPKVVKAVKNGTKKLAKSSGDLVKKAKKALGVSGKKSAGVVEDVAKKTKSTVVSSGKKVGSQLEDVDKKAIQKEKDNVRIEVKNGKDTSVYFHIDDWSGYPDTPRPEGPFRIVEGDEYNNSRKLANKVNATLHKQDPSLNGFQIHEMHPVKFGGNPTDIDNKIALTKKEHAKYTAFWNKQLRNMKGKYENEK